MTTDNRDDPRGDAFLDRLAEDDSAAAQAEAARARAEFFAAFDEDSDALAGAEADEAVPPFEKTSGEDGAVDTGPSDSDGEDGLAPDFPFQALGFAGEMRWYLDQAGQLRGLPVSRHNTLELKGLAGTRIDILYRDFGKTRSDGRPALAADTLIARVLAASARRAWSPAGGKVRGRGVWCEPGLAPAYASQLIVNLGDRLLVDGRALAPGKIVGANVYVAGEAIDPPSEGESVFASGPGALALDYLSHWSFRRGSVDRRLLLGMIGINHLAGSLPWKPQLWLTGPSQAGKSRLVGWIKKICGNWLRPMIDASPAGIIQAVGFDALPVLVDEAIGVDNEDREQALLRLVRLLGDGGRVLRGSAEGVAQDYLLRTTASYVSASLPAFGDQDFSRLVVVAVKHRPGGLAAPEGDDEDCRRLGAELRQRVIERHAAIGAAFEVYLAAFEAGAADRSERNHALLLACSRVMLTDEALTPEQAAAEIAELKTELAQAREERRPEPEVVLEYLLSQTWPNYGYDRQPVRGWIAAAATVAYSTEARARANGMLAQLGIAVLPRRGVADTLFVASTNPQLGLLFERSPWKSGAGKQAKWTSLLGQLPGAAIRRARFGNAARWGAHLPLALALADDDGLEADNFTLNTG